jgi:NAD(P)H-hydrate epimerase
MLLDETLTTKEMRAVEMNSEYLGVSKLQLMENAGRAIAVTIMERFGKKSKVVIVCGPGGNGGDGFVAARHLAGAEYLPRVILLGDPKNIGSKEARANWLAIKGMSETIRLSLIRDSAEIEPLKGDVIVDALIGTGVRGALNPPYREMVDAINASDGYTIAVDVPTGVNADTGEASGSAVQADLTIMFHKEKTGLKNALNHTGELDIAPIGIHPEAERYAGPGDIYLTSRKRSPEVHKGDFGSLLVIGGSETYSGAPALAAMAAYATGADLVYVAAPESVAQVVAGFSPSLITVKLKGSRLNSKNIEKLGSLYEKIDAAVIGPGLGLHAETKGAVIEIIEELEERKTPVLIDADAVKSYPLKREIATDAIFTPHAREFEILTGKAPSGTLKERGERVRKEAARLDATILLKGNVDIASDGTHTRFNRTGNPGMTVGGTGDVLSGIAGALLANGVSSLQSAVAAAFINGVAGDMVTKEIGYHMTPGHLLEKIPYVIEDALQERLRAHLD